MDEYRYCCPKCGWEGSEEEVVQLAGSLWDYTEHDACPVCWERDAIDIPVEPYVVE